MNRSLAAVALGLVLAACGSSSPSRPAATTQQQPPANSSNSSRAAGYGPCIESARDSGGNITDQAVEDCLDKHLR